MFEKKSAISNTHLHLTRVFTGVLCAVVMLIGLSFISAQFFTELSSEKRDFSLEIRRISEGIAAGEDFLSSIEEGTSSKRQKKGVPDFEKFAPNRVSFYVVDASGAIEFQNLLENPSFESLDFKQEQITRISGQFVYQEYVGDKLLVVYDDIKTRWWGFLQSLALMSGMILVFSGLFYFIGYRFVGNTLRPVEQSMKDMGDFIHNAGHELKTPLAVMRGNLQIMKAEQAFDTELLDSSMRNIDSMNGLLEGLRELAEVGKVKTQEFLSLDEVSREIAQKYKSLAQSKHISLTVKGNSEFSFRANTAELDMLIGNLIENAIKYSKDNSKVELYIEKNTLKISDSGIGMSEEETRKMYDRFYQVSSVRSSQGFGIGLSLVKKIIELNNWKIHCESETGKGTSFEIIFS